MSKQDKRQHNHDEEDGPRQLPPAVTAERRTLQLFLTYLEQHATRNWLMALAHDANRLREFANYHHTLTILVGDVRDDAGLRRLITAAPALDAVLGLAIREGIGPIPLKAYPTQKCMAACLKAYKAWVERQAGL